MDISKLKGQMDAIGNQLQNVNVGKGALLQLSELLTSEELDANLKELVKQKLNEILPTLVPVFEALNNQLGE